MKRVLLLLCFLPWLLSASSQELPDSTFLDAEMEDSISGMAIMPVKKPKKLLDSIITRLLYDMERKPIVRKYKVENTFVVGMLLPAEVELPARIGPHLEEAGIERVF